MASRSHSAGPAAARAALLDCLLARHGAKLRRQAGYHSNSAADAEDALQNACMQFLRSYIGPAELSAALPWLLLAVKHSAWKLGARRRRCEALVALDSTDAPDGARPALTAVDERPGPAERAERSEHLAERRALLARLKPDERTALLLFALGYSYREIAARQGWTYTKVNRCLAEGRAALRQAAARQGVNRGADPSCPHMPAQGRRCAGTHRASHAVRAVAGCAGCAGCGHDRKEVMGMELRCPECCSPEVTYGERGGRLRCGNCGARFDRGEALVSLADAEAHAAYLYGDDCADPRCFERAEQLVGATVRDSQGREWVVEEAGEKDGWPTIGGKHYWDRPDEVTVLRPAPSAPTNEGRSR